ncbi:hypothetical protein PACILC2_56090 [Paenibacillus cisolokensis]|uniref:Extracellular solute-binding protein n=1 Tax=Paenibacillus cisolokensis TaxID=1658519 RepID=A0ABQ4NFS7_9BACL|nr:extracellular solute-binding protein [Paenibacillus cisolokensis]GIQ67041.1 hypothetical protein PACILC2_56090 [Paenibacillus cisolokensis]
MKKKMWKSLAVATALATALAGCSSGGESGQEPEGGATGPKEIGNEVITIRMAKRSFPDIAPEPKDLWMWKEYEKMSNVKVDWIAIPDATVSEKKNLMMSSGDYPEAFFGSMGFSSDEVVKYGAQGIFLPLEELIEQHAPNLKALFAEYPEVKKAITAPDGHIYSLPYVDTSIMDASLRYYINNDWLTNLGLKPPETLDEFTEMLKNSATRTRTATAIRTTNTRWLIRATSACSSSSCSAASAWATAGCKARDNGYTKIRTDKSS